MNGKQNIFLHFINTMLLKKTTKGNIYKASSYEAIDKENKKIADKGGSVFDMYDDPMCKHGEYLEDCFICE